MTFNMLQDVLQFSYGAEASLKKRKRQDGSTEYTVVARHNPLTGRIEAETGNADDEPEDALYRDCISWCNPAEYETWLQQVDTVHISHVPLSMLGSVTEQSSDSHCCTCTVLGLIR